MLQLRLPEPWHPIREFLRDAQWVEVVVEVAPDGLATNEPTGEPSLLLFDAREGRLKLLLRLVLRQEALLLSLRYGDLFPRYRCRPSRRLRLRTFRRLPLRLRLRPGTRPARSSARRGRPCRGDEQRRGSTAERERRRRNGRPPRRGRGGRGRRRRRRRRGGSQTGLRTPCEACGGPPPWGRSKERECGARQRQHDGARGRGTNHGGQRRLAQRSASHSSEVAHPCH
mmetsp:Transcript_166280/g.533998  ORF Transcript_166280/g.533998 Transcript_166280/m.533998 type:complete len:227 (-) Transcript_166280:38-718(-)